MFRNERYFDKNDRPQNFYGQKEDVLDAEDDDDEITLVTGIPTDNVKSSKSGDKNSS